MVMADHLASLAWMSVWYHTLASEMSAESFSKVSPHPDL